MDGRGRVALLRPQVAVLGEPLLDLGHVLVDHRFAGLPHGRFGRQVPHVQILAHGRLADRQFARYRGDGRPFLSHAADRVDDGHADHCLSGSFDWKK